MRAFSFAWSLPVTWQTWRLHNSILRTRNPMLHTNITALWLIERQLLPIEVLHCGNRNFRPLWFLWPWPWHDDHHIRTRPVVHGDMPYVQVWSSYVKAFESYRLTDTYKYTVTVRQTDNYIPRCFAGGQKISMSMEGDEVIVPVRGHWRLAVAKIVIISAVITRTVRDCIYVRQGEYGLDPDSVSGLLPKRNGHFFVHWYSCDNISMKIKSLCPEI